LRIYGDRKVASLRRWDRRGSFCHVITGLVPVISMKKSAAPHMIGMAGTRPAMT
jgi:hypothetical protein